MPNLPRRSACDHPWPLLPISYLRRRLNLSLSQLSHNKPATSRSYPVILRWVNRDHCWVDVKPQLPQDRSIHATHAEIPGTVQRCKLLSVTNCADQGRWVVLARDRLHVDNMPAATATVCLPITVEIDGVSDGEAVERWSASLQRLSIFIAPKTRVKWLERWVRVFQTIMPDCQWS